MHGPQTPSSALGPVARTIPCMRVTILGDSSHWRGAGVGHAVGQLRRTRRWYTFHRMPLVLTLHELPPAPLEPKRSRRWPDMRPMIPRRGGRQYRDVSNAPVCLAHYRSRLPWPTPRMRAPVSFRRCPPAHALLKASRFIRHVSVRSTCTGSDPRARPLRRRTHTRAHARSLRLCSLQAYTSCTDLAQDDSGS